jgi:outer membrane protein assembly factor BamB
MQVMLRPALLASVIAVTAGCSGGGHAAPSSRSTPQPPPTTSQPRVTSDCDWPRFGFDAGRSSAGPIDAGVPAEGLGKPLTRRTLHLPGTVDSSPIYLHDANVGGRPRDVFVVTTSYGITLALAATTGEELWRFTPASLAALAGSAQITNASPVADPGGRFVYAASPDGYVHKLALGDGRESTNGAWPAQVTRDPGHEKLGTALNVAGSVALATTGGYIGDAPPYQGHVVAIDRTSGRRVWVFNALCSDRRELIDPASCDQSGAAIWARSGAVVTPDGGHVLVATGNGRYDDHTDWGDSVLELRLSDGRLTDHYTPPDYAQLEAGDVDLGSTAPALLSSHLAVQGGKDGRLRLLTLPGLELRQTVPAPGGSGVFSTPAVVRGADGPLLLVANASGTSAYALLGGRLAQRWSVTTPGTSPVAAGGLVFVYDPVAGDVNVYRPGSPRVVARLPGAPGHWNSPVVADGRIAVPEGSANGHATSGTLEIFSYAGAGTCRE